MKPIRFLLPLLCAIVSFAVFSSCSAKRKSVHEPLSEEIKNAVESREFEISVNQMVPMIGRVQHLTSPYSLTLRNDSVLSHLPFFGRAYSVPFGGGRGLIFDGLLSDYKLRFSPKGSAKISFRVRTTEDTYVFSVEIFNNGASHIRVNSNNRQGIGFYGEFLRE